MFTLLQSIWMFAAAGIIMPVLIHFWNRKQGKTLKVGSISLLSESYKQQAKNIQLKERLLLLLRSLLVLLLALILSVPVWKKQLDSGKEKGWVLMEKDNLPESYSKYKTVIDSLIAQKYEFHYFDDQFQKTDLPEALKQDSATTNNYSYWTLLSSLDQQIPTGLPVYLFTTNGLSKFAGKRPEVAMSLKWFTYTPKDSVDEFLAKAYMTSRDSVRLVTASSGPSGTSVNYRNASFTGISLPRNAGENLPVSYSQNDRVTVDTATLAITIFTDKYYKDAAYVKAAFEAIRQYSRRRINLTVSNKSGDIPQAQDWLFWLSDQAPVLSKAKNIFVYANGKPQHVSSFIETGNSANGDEYLPLNQRVSYPADIKNTKAIWQDGFGKPLLLLEKNDIPVYHFYSHFDPSWNDLAWHNAFPRMMFNLVYQNRSDAGLTDNRMMDDQQALPVFTSSPKTSEKEKFTENIDLSQAFWFAAFLLFFLERFISFRTKMQKANA